VRLPGKPEFAVADGKGFIFDNIEDKSEIVRLDAKDPKVIATCSVSPCESPSVTPVVYYLLADKNCSLASSAPAV